MKTKYLVLPACALLAAGAAVAQESPARGELTPRQTEIFQVVDENEDGYITREEAEGKLIVDWSAADENADGRLDVSEFSMLEEVPPGGETQAPR